MRLGQASYLRIFAALTLLASPLIACSQQLKTIAPNLARTEGVDAASGIAYTRLYVSSQPSSDPTTLDLTQPTLTAQCTKRPNGKLSFELFVNFGGVTDTAFYRPWTPADGGIFPPATKRVTLSMEFLGYTKVKPRKREWEYVLQPSGQLRYTPPGDGSNLEEISYFFQYLRALPTLRLTGDGHDASFLTTALQAQLRKEPLCTVSGS